MYRLASFTEAQRNKGTQSQHLNLPFRFQFLWSNNFKRAHSAEPILTLSKRGTGRIKNVRMGERKKITLGKRTAKFCRPKSITLKFKSFLEQRLSEIYPHFTVKAKGPYYILPTLTSLIVHLSCRWDNLINSPLFATSQEKVFAPCLDFHTFVMMELTPATIMGISSLCHIKQG